MQPSIRNLLTLSVVDHHRQERKRNNKSHITLQWTLGREEKESNKNGKRTTMIRERERERERKRERERERGRM